MNRLTAIALLTAIAILVGLFAGCAKRDSTTVLVSRSGKTQVQAQEGNTRVSVPEAATAAEQADTPTEPGNAAMARLAHSRPVFGEVKVVEDALLIITPELPPHPASGQSPEPPSEPGELRLILDADTEYQLEGVTQQANPFAAGDEVVVWVSFDQQTKLFSAELVMDQASYAGLWSSSGHPVWAGANAGEPQWLMPVYGTLASLTETSITIDVDLPGVFRRQPAPGEPPPAPAFDVPQTLTYIVDADTKWIVDGLELSPVAFAVGDKITVMPRQPLDGQPQADELIADVVTKGDIPGKPQDGVVDAPAAGGAEPRGNDVSLIDSRVWQGSGNQRTGRLAVGL